MLDGIEEGSGKRRPSSKEKKMKALAALILIVSAYWLGHGFARHEVRMEAEAALAACGTDGECAVAWDLVQVLRDGAK